MKQVEVEWKCLREAYNKQYAKNHATMKKVIKEYYMPYKSQICEWKEEPDYWSTSCGQEFVILDGSPSENDMKYCCYCGKDIEETYDICNSCYKDSCEGCNSCQKE